VPVVRDLAEAAEDVAQAVLFALRQPSDCEVRELVVASAQESLWP
jgi:NADP-dependent 3-hydroxy acid dehydrogenase YdfG